MINNNLLYQSLPRLIRLLLAVVLFAFLVACQSEEATPSQTDESATAVSTAPTDEPTNKAMATTEPTPTETAVPATHTPAPTPTVAAITIETLNGPVQVEPLPPAGYGSLLDNNIQSGEWTESEGIIFLLKSFVGEIDASTLPEVMEPTGTPIVRRAADLLNDESLNPDDRAEIERLLNILTPSPEALDFYSAPADESSGKPNYIAKPAQLQGDCANLAAQGYPTKDLVNVTCFIYTEAQLNGFKYRVYYPNTWQDDEDKIELINTALLALTDSASTYSNLATIKDINMVFSYANGGTSLAHQSYFNLDQACPVTLFASSKAEGMDSFKQTIAHEVFHCVQDWNFTTAPYNSHKWWLEGSAEYFSNVVYPTINDEHGWLESFNRKSVTQSLMQMEYENFIFFQYLANQISDSGLISLLKAMSANGGPSAHASYLAGYTNMDNAFQDFVVSFLSSGVPDTGGGMIKPGQIYAITGKDISAKGETDFPAQPFVATRYGIKYKQEKRFLLAEKEDGEGNYSTVLHPIRQDKDAWSALPEEIRSKCEEDVRYVLASTTVKNNYKFTINATEVEVAECDPCLLGSWDVEPNSFAEFISGIAARTPNVPAGFTIEVAGHDYLKFEEDGQMTTLRDNFQLIMSIPGNPKLTNTINSHGNGTYTADGEEITVRNLVDTVDSVTVTTADGQIVTTLAGSTANVSFFGNSGSFQVNDINSDSGPDSATGIYVCTEETLDITIPEGSVRFLRVEEILPTPVPTPSP